MISIVIPAHNEEQVLGRLLAALLSDAEPDEFDIVVVANGCSDGTEAVAAAHGVRVVSTPVPSKREALRLGDEAARGFPRMYVDADVELGTADVRALAAALRDALAAAPERELPMAGRPWVVRRYYALWSRLPHVRDGLFGRGVIAVSEEGNRRLRELPQVMADDLAASHAFTPAERVVVRTASVRIQPPRTVGDLLRRRVRAATGVGEWERNSTVTVRTSPRDILAIVRRRPLLADAAAVFLAVTVLARRRANRAIRSGDYTTWLRDESSRAQDLPGSKSQA
ncbi:glycosyltransferase family 2 protein [Acrocarpospora sp. B8E8]|uniref:glycosyltransferase family 2 protein n=1 Tax=Acrocarpospora sp. B8E8 TaxID=3153572 RepID=UPI00325C7D9C